VIDPREYILSKFPDSAFNSNGRLHAKCPFHDDRSASFSIRDDGVFTCGSPKCGEKGGFPYFYKQMEGIESWALVYRALRIAQVTPDIEDLFAGRTERKKEYWISDFPQPPMTEPIQSVKYLVDRGLGGEVVQHYGLQYGKVGECAGIDIQNTIIAPVFDLNGAYITFQVRYLSSASKTRWKMPSGSAAQNILYGGWLIGSYTKYLWVVEGASDVWNLHKLGRQAVGVFTTKASSAQLNRLRDLSVHHDLTIAVCMDGDSNYTTKTGKYVDCGMSIYSELCAYGLSPELVRLRPEEDPGMLTQARLIEIERESGIEEHA